MIFLLLWKFQRRKLLFVAHISAVMILNYLKVAMIIAVRLCGTSCHYMDEQLLERLTVRGCAAPTNPLPQRRVEGGLRVRISKDISSNFPRGECPIEILNVELLLWMVQVSSSK